MPFGVFVMKNACCVLDTAPGAGVAATDTTGSELRAAQGADPRVGVLGPWRKTAGDGQLQSEDQIWVGR